MGSRGVKMGNFAEGCVLVTGAAGFIGSHVCEQLFSRGAAVLGLDNFDPFYDPSLKRTNVAAIQAAAQGHGAPFNFVEADITSVDAMQRIFTQFKPAGVIHLAAKAGVRPSIADPVGYVHANVVGTSVLLERARESGCKRFVLASSSSVYGNASNVPFREDDPVDQPISPYAATKRACELLAHAHHALTRMPVACLRFFTVFGPRQRPDLAIQQFIRRISRGESIRMFGDGTTSRDYTFIDDIVSGVLAAYERIDAHGFRVWNLGGSHPTSLREMIATIERVVARPARIEPAPAQPGDVERTYADLTRSRSELGYDPKTSFERGVALQWQYAQRTNA